MRALLTIVSLLAAACDTGPSATANPRPFVVDLVDPGPLQPSQQVSRSQRGSDPTRPSGANLWYVQMTAPLDLVGVIGFEDGFGGVTPLGEAASVFLEGNADGNVRSATSESTGAWALSVSPDVYDVVVARDALLGRNAASFLDSLVLAEPWPDAVLPLAIPEAVEGHVLTTAGTPVPGMFITVFRAEEPRWPMGVTVESDSTGRFGFEVPPGRYDLVVAAPSDGSVPYPPLHILGQSLPLLPGFEIRAELPVLDRVRVRGTLALPTGTPVQGRLRISGWVPPPPLLPGAAYSGGTYRIEIETDPDGGWEAELPRGNYTALAVPRISSRDLGEARLSFVAPEDNEQLQTYFNVTGAHEK